MTRGAAAAPKRRAQAGRTGVRALAILLCIASLAACSPERLVLRRTADALAASGNAWSADDDPALIEAAAPFGLKTLETLIDRLPDHPGLRLAAARGFTQYAYAFVQLPADELEETDLAGAYARRDRARRLYLRARDHALAGLGLADPAAVARFTVAPARFLAAVPRDRAPLLYWAAASWAAAIALGKDQPALIATWPAAEALLQRAEVLDPDMEGGGVHLLRMAIEAGRGGAPTDTLVRLRALRERALASRGGRGAAPWVAMAEAIAALHGDPAEFRDQLERALAVDVSAPGPHRLADVVAQRRARWLQKQTEILFPE